MNILVTSKPLEPIRKQIENFGHNVLWKVEDDYTEEDVKSADIIIGTLPLDLVKKAENLKYFHTVMAGSDNYAGIDTVRNAILTNGTGCYSLSIAEYLITMILYFYKKIDQYVVNQQNHVYQDMGKIKAIEGSNVLVIGCGSIGMTFAKKINALGAHVIGIKRTPAEKPDFLDALYQEDKIDECIKKADIIAMSLPQNSQTKHLMNKERLSMIKDGALLLNVGRASAIDTDALIEELKKNRFQCAIDVYDKEPLDPNSPLWDFKNILLLPHITGKFNMQRTIELGCELALYNLDAFLNNKPLRNVVDFSTGYKKSNT